MLLNFTRVLRNCLLGVALLISLTTVHAIIAYDGAAPVLRQNSAYAHGLQQEAERPAIAENEPDVPASSFDSSVEAPDQDRLSDQVVWASSSSSRGPPVGSNYDVRVGYDARLLFVAPRTTAELSESLQLHKQIAQKANRTGAAVEKWLMNPASANHARYGRWAKMYRGIMTNPNATSRQINFAKGIRGRFVDRRMSSWMESLELVILTCNLTERSQVAPFVPTHFSQMLEVEVSYLTLVGPLK